MPFPIAKTHRFLRCTGCYQDVHIKCGNVTPKQFINYTQHDLPWTCAQCVSPIYNFSQSFFNNSTESIDTDDLNNSSALSVSNQEPSRNDGFKGITHLAEVRKSHLKTFVGEYLNINSLRYKIDSIRDILNRNYLNLFMHS